MGHWRRRNQCLWALSGLYNCGCILFLVTFLANVRAEDGRTWLESIIAVLVVVFIIQPFLLSLLCTFVTAVVVKRSPDLIAEVRHDFVIDAARGNPESKPGAMKSPEVSLDVVDETRHQWSGVNPSEMG